MISNLKDIYQEIYKSLEELYDIAYAYDFDYDAINDLNKQINLLSKHFGIHKLKINVPPFKADELVQLCSDENGDYIISLDKNDKRRVNAFQALTKTPVYKWFYE